ESGRHVCLGEHERAQLPELHGGRALGGGEVRRDATRRRCTGVGGRSRAGAGDGTNRRCAGWRAAGARCRCRPRAVVAAARRQRCDDGRDKQRAAGRKAHRRMLPRSLTASGGRGRLLAPLNLSARGTRMEYPTIEKPPVDQFRVRPNLDDYERLRASLHYPDVIKELDGLPGGALNIAHEAIDRHVAAGRGDRLCWLWEGKNGAIERYTYADARRMSNRFANMLRA